jgi:hypothetical protein
MLDELNNVHVNSIAALFARHCQTFDKMHCIINNNLPCVMTGGTAVEMVIEGRTKHDTLDDVVDVVSSSMESMPIYAVALGTWRKH